MSHIFLPLECVYCNHHSEDANHLFLECPFCVDVFSNLSSMMDWPLPPPVRGEISFIEYFSSLPKVIEFDCISKIALSWWFIWYARNEISFRQDTFHPRKIALMIKAFVDKLDGVPPDVRMVVRGSPFLGRPQRMSRKNACWQPPPSSYFIINFDGSKLKEDNASLGFVIRYEVGKLQLCGAQSIGPSHPVLVAETWALGEGIKAARMLG